MVSVECTVSEANSWERLVFRTHRCDWLRRSSPVLIHFLGISHRIWLLVAGCFGLFTLSRLLIRTSPHHLRPFPPSNLIDSIASSDEVSPYRAAQLLTAGDYLNASASDPAPFDFCPVFGPGDVVAERRGQWGLLKSRMHTGSGARVQRVVQKAMAGLPVTISVLGGSGGSTPLCM